MRDRKYIIVLLSLGIYKNGGNENGDRGRDMVWVLAGVRGCVTVDAGHGLVTLLSLYVSIKDRPLHKTLDKSQTYYLEHILGYGRLKDLLLSCRGSGSFQTDCLGGFWVRRSLHHTKSGTQGRGLGVLVWTRTRIPRTGG